MSKQLHEVEQSTQRPELDAATKRALRPLSREDLTSLVVESESPRVTLIQATHRAHPENAQDPIRFRNLVREIESQLSDETTGQGIVDALRALDTETFWSHQRGSLAIFATPSRLEVYRLDAELPELARVGEQFQIASLLPHFDRDQTFFALTVSKNQVKVYQGNSSALAELSPTPVPASLEDALGEEIDIPHQQHHTAARGGADIVHHGHGPAGSGEARDFRFMREIDKGLWELLEGERAPLILGGVEAYGPLFRSLCSYPHLCPEGVTGNLERLPAAELHAKLWPIAEAEAETKIAKLAERASAAWGSGLAETDGGELLKAALQGRLAELILSEEVLADEGVNQSAVEAIRSGAEVMTLPPEKMPEGVTQLGVLRW